MHTTQFSPEAVRAAIYRAADRVAHAGSNYSFDECSVHACNTPMCMIGWIGFELGFKPSTPIHDVRAATGIVSWDLYQSCAPGAILRNDNKDAAHGMRKYADATFPAVASRALEDHTTCAPHAECRALTPWSNCSWRESALAKLKDIAVEA